jgi:hypothetical protein
MSSLLSRTFSYAEGQLFDTLIRKYLPRGPEGQQR